MRLGIHFWNLILTITLAWMAAPSATLAAVRYVDAASPNPAPPHDTWSTAARIIQDAVDAAQAGDEILVTNGVYATGGRAVYGRTNRVAIDKPLAVRSVNGPTATTIMGWQVPGTTNGDDAIRCVYLTNGASLTGFTLTRGATGVSGGQWEVDKTRNGGGAFCDGAAGVISNCVFTGNSANGGGGGLFSGVAKNCVFKNNSAGIGGGAAYATLINCAVFDNQAIGGGGANVCTLNRCTVTGNRATIGGGVFDCTANSCIIFYNQAAVGENHGNHRYFKGYNYCCTTPLTFEGVGNLNLDPEMASPIHLSAASPCRSTGNPTNSAGIDIEGKPWGSPPSIGCDEFHAGFATGAVSVAIQAQWTNLAAGWPVEFKADINGQATRSVWDFGDGTTVTNRPFLSHTWTNTGAYDVTLTVFNDRVTSGISATTTVQVVAVPVYHVALVSSNPVPPYTTWATAARTIQEAVDVAQLPGATVLVSNGTYNSGERIVSGILPNRVVIDKPIQVRSVNGPGVTTIQGYKPAGATNWDGSVRCAYLAEGAMLSGFTITGGGTRNTGYPYTDKTGGGLYCAGPAAVVSNCWIQSNAAVHSSGGADGGTFIQCSFFGNSAEYGGGVAAASLTNCSLSGNTARVGGGTYGCALRNCSLTEIVATGEGDGGGGGAVGGILIGCILTDNYSRKVGGGVLEADLINCTIIGNTAELSGGGTHGCFHYNCIVYYNTAPEYENAYVSPYASFAMCYSCTTPLPPNGLANISLEPVLSEDRGPLSDSPCINAGKSSYLSLPLDIGGAARIANGIVDIGAYEYQEQHSGSLAAWMQQYGLPYDGSADNQDADGDGRTNQQEWRCRTNPNNALSVLRVQSEVVPNPGHLVLRWPGAAGVNYVVEQSTNLPVFIPLALDVVGRDGTMSYTNNAAGILARGFYRVRVAE